MLVVAILPAHLMRSVAGGFAPWNTVAISLPGRGKSPNVFIELNGFPAMELIPGRYTIYIYISINDMLVAIPLVKR